MRVRVISPWYPDYAAPYSGVFVRHQVEAAAAIGHDVRVDVPRVFPAPSGPVPAAVARSLRSLAEVDFGAAFQTIGNTTYVPAAVPARSGHLGRAKAFASAIALRREFDDFDAEVVHAHLGLPTGWASMSIGERPLVVTEHQSTLGDILGDPASSEAYEATIREAAAFICVSPILKGQLRDHYGGWIDDAVEIVPNIVDLSHIPFSIREESPLRSWIYVGGVSQHKGVELLLESFAVYKHHVEPGATLTIVGVGPLQRWVRGFAHAKQIDNAVSLLGAMPHSEIGALLASAEVMVHLSPRETFGISPLEAIGSGLPVVAIHNGGSDFTWGEHEDQCGVLLEAGAGSKEVVEAVIALRQHRVALDPRQGRAMVEQRYSPEAFAARIDTVYRRCAS